jgi:hypothetical protein
VATKPATEAINREINTNVIFCTGNFLVVHLFYVFTPYSSFSNISGSVCREK